MKLNRFRFDFFFVFIKIPEFTCVSGAIQRSSDAHGVWLVRRLQQSWFLRLCSFRIIYVLRRVPLRWMPPPRSPLNSNGGLFAHTHTRGEKKKNEAKRKSQHKKNIYTYIDMYIVVDTIKTFSFIRCSVCSLLLLLHWWITFDSVNVRASSIRLLTFDDAVAHVKWQHYCGVDVCGVWARPAMFSLMAFLSDYSTDDLITRR